VPSVETHPDLIAPFLSDAAHVPGGFAAGVALPRDAGEVAALVTFAQRVLPVGAQSSLTGGATPRGEVILNTRALTGITMISGLVRAGAGVPLTELQRALRSRRSTAPSWAARLPPMRPALRHSSTAARGNGSKP